MIVACARLDAALACTSVWLVACGRLGFETLEIEPDAVQADAVQACTSGQRLVPAGTFNASPRDPVNACGDANVLASDGLVAGLDLVGDTADHCAELDGTLSACGCVGIDLGAVFGIARFVVRAGPSPSACSRACEGNDCNTGRSFTAFYGATRSSYRGLTRPLSDSLADYTLDLDDTVRYVLVCREAWSADRDDVVVDSIVAECR